MYRTVTDLHLRLSMKSEAYKTAPIGLITLRSDTPGLYAKEVELIDQTERSVVFGHGESFTGNPIPWVSGYCDDIPTTYQNLKIGQHMILYYGQIENTKWYLALSGRLFVRGLG